MAPKRNKSRSYNEKYAILKYMEENPQTKKKDIAARFDLKQNSLSDIIKNREKIIKAVENADEAWKGTRKRVKTGTYDDVAEALLMWVRQQEFETGVPLNGGVLQAQAKLFAVELGHETQPSPTWVDRFIKRHSLSNSSSAGTARKHKEDVVIAWNEGVFKDILKRYSPSDIYSCEETCLYWKLLPGRYCGLKSKNPGGYKKNRKRITVLVCANMAGSDKVPLYVVGKMGCPSAFRNVQSLPVDYKANQKAVMTKTLFREWMYKMDNIMGSQDRKIVMVLASCPAHLEEELENIELVLLPDCLTAASLPVNRGIIHALKQNYRHTLASRLLLAVESRTQFQWDLLDAVLALRSSWAKVTNQAIAEAFKSAGFAATPPSAQDVEASPEDSKSDEEGACEDFRILWDRLSDLHGYLPPLQEYIGVDDGDECRQELTYGDILSSLNGASDDDAELEWNVTQGSPTLEEAFKAVNVIRRFSAKTNGHPLDMSKDLDSYESFLMGELTKRCKQTPEESYL